MKRKLLVAIAISIAPMILLMQGFGLMAWFAYIPLLLVGKSLKPRQLVLYVAYCALMTVLIGVPWIFDESVFVLLILPPLLAAVVAVTIVSYRYSLRYGRFGPLLFGAVHAIMMSILSAVQGGWFLYSHAWSIPQLMAANAFWGPIITGSILMAIQAGVTEPKRNVIAIIIGVLLLTAPIMIEREAELLDVRVAAVQSSYDQSWEWRQENAEVIVEELLSLSDDARAQGARIIVWPEYAVPVDFLSYREHIRTRLADYASTHDVVLIVGSMDFIESSAKHYNAAIVFDTDGSMHEIRSVHPPFFSRYSVAFDTASTATVTVDGEEITIGALLCYEEYYGFAAQKVLALEPDLLVVLSDNSDVGRVKVLSPAMSRIYAERERIPVVRSSNTGTSQITSSDGTVLVRAQSDEEEVLVAQV